MKRRVTAAGTVIVVVVAVAAFAYFRQPAALSVKAPAGGLPVSLIVNGPLGSQHAGEIVAARSGLFEREGLAVEFKAGGNGLDAIAAVVNGTATFGVMEADSFLFARAKGAPIVAFGAALLETPVVFYALEKSGIRTPRDFIGKRVGRRAGTDAAFIYDALLRTAGMSRSQVRETATDDGLAALLDDKVDVIPGYAARESLALWQHGIAYTVIRVSDYGLHVPGPVYFTTEKFIHEYPSVAQRLLRALIGGWNLTYAETANSLALIVEAGGRMLTPEQVQFELSAQRDFVKPPGRRLMEFDDLQWKQLHGILMSARLVDSSLDLGRAVNYDILKEVYRKPISFGN